jgi:hypothetical protein
MFMAKPMFCANLTSTAIVSKGESLPNKACTGRLVGSAFLELF